MVWLLKQKKELEVKRNEILINGKSLEQIEFELSRPFPKEKMEYVSSGDGYFSVETYEERMIEVLGGRRWFNTDCQPVQIYQVNSCYVVSVSVTVEILSDDNEVVWKKSANGGSNVIIIQKTGNPRSLKSEISIAMSEAYKGVYKQFGMGIDQLRAMKTPNTGTSCPSSRQPNQPPGGKRPGTVNPGNYEVRSGRHPDSWEKGNQEEKIIAVKFLSRFNSIRGGYSADVVCCSTGQPRKLVIFKEAFPTIEVYCTMAKFVATYAKNTKITFYGYENVYRGTMQYIFKRPSVKEKSTK